jgi:hypothetical protein
LKNNDFGNPLPYGESFILPVFMAKYHDASLINDPNRPEYYGDGNKGCNNVQDSCDYCSERSGRALLDLQNNGYQPYLSYVKIFSRNSTILIQPHMQGTAIVISLVTAGLNRGYYRITVL